MKTFLFSSKKKHWRLSAFAMAFCALITLSGCIEDVPESAASTDSSSTTVSNPTPGVVDDSAGFYVAALKSENYTYITHRGSESGAAAPTYAGSFSQANDCVAGLGDDIMCYVEADELDLWFQGLSLQHNVPSDMCSYVSIKLPWYFTYPAGIGGTLVSYTSDTSGGGAAVITDEQNSAQSVPYCPFDYSGTSGLPNCCEGTYTQVASVIGPSGPEAPTITTGNSWGGAISNCASGPSPFMRWPNLVS